jgi:ribonuclease J
MKLLLHLVRPQHLIPIHGELRMLKQHAKLAEEVGIPKEQITVVENGQIIEFVDGQLRLGERIPGDYIFVDGTGVGDVDRSIVLERESMGQDGILVVNAAVSKDSGHLKGNPEILTRGFMLPEELDTIVDGLTSQVQRAVAKSNGNMEYEILQAVKSYLYQETKRRPYIFVTVNKV